MHFIEHIIEPTKLLLAWQSSDEKHRTRYIVAELTRFEDKINLNYLTNTPDFKKAQEQGFRYYQAFPNTEITHHDVLSTFMRRLPPRARGDFNKYLEGLRLKPNVEISNFALLGYSGAKLLSDGFSIIHPFNDVNSACEILVEAAGYRHLLLQGLDPVNTNDKVELLIEEVNEKTKLPAVTMLVNNKSIGYVNRGLIPTITDWIKNNRINDSWIEKINGTPGKPAVYVYLKIMKSAYEFD